MSHQTLHAPTGRVLLNDTGRAGGGEDQGRLWMESMDNVDRIDGRDSMEDMRKMDDLDPWMT